jgi:hypothetical protein
MLCAGLLCEATEEATNGSRIRPDSGVHQRLKVPLVMVMHAHNRTVPKTHRCHKAPNYDNKQVYE